ncbi:hypothetical protein PG996_008433 [Apiospora saccharicola]|uniref:Glucose-methanol-choline oxidoreductase N-terminal domain-containing protein n=1 Tax=Apiospora saccharicola TaxID=335842 RepID=A0ABR1UXW9_9PEZI
MVSSEDWDYIVVGGGLAGCVVASRLKEYKQTARILVIEAGADVSHDQGILNFQSLDFSGQKFAWTYETLPQEQLEKRKVDIPAGKALGGGSVINGCGWFRGSRADFDSWADLVQEPRWSYEGQLQYFKKTEKWHDNENAEEHGHDGKFQIESPVSTNREYPLADLTAQAWREMGIEPLPGNDMNAGANLGYGQLNENRREGARQIAPLAYSLEGVTVMTDSHVASILLSDGENGGEPKATGVRLTNETEIRGKQVIVSAGAYRTPQILMHSGLGPKAVLEKHGIRTVLDAPEVGQNFSDHVMVRMNWKLKDPSKGYAIDFTNPLLAKGTPINYVASTAVPRGDLEAALARDDTDTGGKGVADPDHPLLKRDFAMMETMVMYLGVPPLGPDGIHISSFLMAMKPTSRGTVTISSRNPADPPVLDPKYYATEVDRYVWRHGLRRVARLMTGETTVLGREVVEAEALPPDAGIEPLTIDASDEDLDKRVRAQGISTYHGAGSCSMGSVVDSDLRFKGVRNLRVVDASVIPIAIGAHIQAAVYALAEQAAFIISEG